MTDNRVTKEHIESQIAKEFYWVPRDEGQEDSRLTICVLTLKNGFEVTGESSCVDAKNFNYEIGRKIAREQAFDKVWMLEGYALRQKLFGYKP